MTGSGFFLHFSPCARLMRTQGNRQTFFKILSLLNICMKPVAARESRLPLFDHDGHR